MRKLERDLAKALGKAELKTPIAATFFRGSSYPRDVVAINAICYNILKLLTKSNNVREHVI